MNFPTITIPDPAAVGRWLDEQEPNSADVWHSPAYYAGCWQVNQWLSATEHVSCLGATPEALLVAIRSAIAANDPLAKLRKEAEAMGYGLMKLPED